MKKIQLNIPLGYNIKSKEYVLSLEEAREVFLTKKQDHITNAVRDGISVKYTSHYIECPFCGHRVYAYARNFNKVFNEFLYIDQRVCKEVIIDWTTPQMSIFGEERSPLEFNRVIETTDDLICLKCKNTMKYSDKTRFVEIERTEQKVLVRAEILDIREILLLPGITSGELKIEFPMYEVACFDFESGSSCLYLETVNRQCISARDFTDDKNVWHSGAVHSAITKNKYVRRIIRNMFNEVWQEKIKNYMSNSCGNKENLNVMVKDKIPFYPSEVGVNELRLLTRFIGYDRRFYSSIPFCKNTLSVYPSFEGIAENLRNACNVSSILNRSENLNKESIKKIFFNNTGLLFYINESERLYMIFNDPNHFCKLLQRESIYKILADLHMRPKIFEFLEDYHSTTLRSKNLIKLITRYWPDVCRYATNYSSMSLQMRKIEQEKWKKRTKGSEIGDFPAFAIPLCHPTERVRNCVIDEFEFSWLKTSDDYEEAGKALKNCLVEWKNENAPVVCVRKNGKIVAALEIREDFVFQAYTHNNQSLRKFPGLLAAYEKWHEKNNLSFKNPHNRYEELEEEEYEDDGDDGLPF